MEESNDEELGWSVIVSSPEKPKGKASIFKIPHHGSKTAHNEMVWQQMVTKSNYVILSPYNHGVKKLPSPKDLQRIMFYTDHAYTTSKFKMPAYKKERAPSVVRTIRETVGKIRTLQPSTGWVRLRNGGNENPHAWFCCIGTRRAGMSARSAGLWQPPSATVGAETHRSYCRHGASKDHKS